jgi:hypothetical protein
MKRRDLEYADRLAVVLIDALYARMPGCFVVAPEELRAALWPFVVRFARLERKARKHGKHKKAARELRLIRREASALLAAREDGPAPLADLRHLARFDVMAWHVRLQPGRPLYEAERTAVPGVLREAS